MKEQTVDNQVESKRKVVLTLTSDLGVDGVTRTHGTVKAFDNGSKEASFATVHEVFGMMREYELTTMINLRLNAAKEIEK